MASLSFMTSVGFLTAWWSQDVCTSYIAADFSKEEVKLSVLIKPGFRNRRMLLLPQISERKGIEVTFG